MLTVLSVAYPFAPVGPDPVGGAEQILATLDARLVHDGHTSIVLAGAGSRAAGWVICAPRVRGTIDTAAHHRAHGAYRRELARLLRDHVIDVIHLHGPDFIDYAPATDLPIVVTLHMPATTYKPIALTRPDIHRICVSNPQRRACPSGTAIRDVIPNGIALDRFRPARGKSNFVLAIGRIAPEKGFDLALRAAHLAEIPLVLAGDVFPYDAHVRHLREDIAPLLDADRRWIGPVAGATKRALLAEARCLLVTSRVDETSCLVAMEALASGTPVVGFRRGALPELVEHGVTGLFVDDPEELPQAIHDAARLSPTACRAVARERACARRMSERYLALYGALARPRRRPLRLEVTRLDTDAQLSALAADWDRLCARSPAATPFQRPGWLLAWRRAFGAGARPRALALHRAGRLVGLVPLEVRDRTLLLIGAGITDYLDAITEPDIDPARYLHVAAEGCAAIHLEGLRPCSRLREVVLGGAAYAGTPSPIVELARRRVPERVAYDLRRLERTGTVRWEDERGDHEALLEGLFALHRARWRERGQEGVLDGPTIIAFHRNAAAGLHARGLLRLVGLRLDERLIGVLYGFSDHGRYHYYLSGFAPDVARLSPGRLLIAHAMGRALDEGATEFDFLRGREAYKYEWGAVDRPSSVYRAQLEEETCSVSAGR